MGQNVTIGGERLGSGKKMKAYLHGYERSTHDLSYVWRSTMAAGTLVPFMTELALPGDTFDIELNCDVLTHPTIGPLFGSYKIQLDVFQVPIRLYQGKLHMNMLNIGNDMSKVPLPQLLIKGQQVTITDPIDNQQINPSCIFSYLGMRGVGGLKTGNPPGVMFRQFNAVPLLGYWDIYKNYYANKQEEIGAVIHQTTTPPEITIVTQDFVNPSFAIPDAPPAAYTDLAITDDTTVVITGINIDNQVKASYFRFYLDDPREGEITRTGDQLFNGFDVDVANQTVTFSAPKINTPIQPINLSVGAMDYNTSGFYLDNEPEIVTFPLENIDTMRQDLLSHFADTPYIIEEASNAPYGLPFEVSGTAPNEIYAQKFGQEGLALKTYNSDLFNNWIDTEWIDGVDGISAVTAVSTVGDSFTIDELNLSKKIYVMLNRIAISGGTYDDWLDAVYDHDRIRTAENPMYLGGLIQRLVFQEVVNNSASEGQPLGTLAGRGTVQHGYKKGGEITAKVDEPSYLIGIVSLTPNIDYSQGNKWDTNLRTMNDLHKPALDEIGYQDLITDQMAWWDTTVGNTNLPTFKSAGKQPAWINYMTNVNKVLGNFADQAQQMFMVLNRRYDVEFTADTVPVPSITDLTTYIDPTKFNHIFADTRRDAQNFWTQIGVNITARRKMSAKVIPNL